MSMNTRLLLITFLCVFSIGQCIAQTWYTGKDNFRQAIFQDSILSDYNYQAEKDIVNVTETDIHPGEGFRPSLSLDIANRNNRENKKYPVYRQSQTGTITKAGYVEKTVWGVVWGYGDSSNFHALLLRAGNPDPYGYHIPELQYSIITVAEGDTIFRRIRNIHRKRAGMPHRNLPRRQTLRKFGRSLYRKRSENKNEKLVPFSG